MLKLLDLNSIRSRMVSGFLFLVLLILILALVSLYLLSSTGRVANTHGHISQLEIYTLILFKNDNDFFDLESTNDAFFVSHHSVFLQRRDSLLASVGLELKKVMMNKEEKNAALTNELVSIDSALQTYNEKFMELESLMFRKGFKNYGLEGVMRIHAHNLEDQGNSMNINQVLNLRRHEKDFFLRQDTFYVSQFRKRADALLKVLEKDPHGNRFQIYHLTEYKKLFLELVSIHKRLGLTSSKGLRNELNNLTNSISRQYLALAQYSYTLSSGAQQQARVIFSILLVCAILFSIISGIWISRRLSEPIALLSKHMENADLESAGTKIDYDLQNAAIEIQTLSRSFNRLLEKSEAQMAEIKAKSKLVKKKNKELKKLNKELDNFLYSTAHDLRSPLTSLQGLFNLLSYQGERANFDGYLYMMRMSVERMESFISQIVSYSKNKRMQLHIEKVNLTKAIEGIIDSHKFIEGAENINWSLDLRESTTVFTDLNRITILFNNLISNGIKYADFNKLNPFIRIELRADLESIIIQFTDNGIGISEEHLGKIFDMFYRADTNSKGSGLGLYIFKQTIKRMKGFVKVESVVGEGTKFFIQLPNHVSEMTAHDIKFPVSSAYKA